MHSLVISWVGLSFALLLPLVPAKASSSPISFGIHAVSGFSLTGDAKEQTQLDIAFSRDVFIKSDGKPVEFRIMDGGLDAYKDLHEDYTYLQKAITLNGSDTAALNAAADKSKIDATSFPKSAGGVYLVPILYFAYQNVLSIRFDTTWLAAQYDANDSFTLTFVSSLFTIAKGDDTYALSQDISFVVKKDGSSTSDYAFVPYEADPVYGWSQDGSVPQTMPIRAVEISDITPIGTPRADSAGWDRYNCYFVVFFDQPLSHKYYPEITRPRSVLSQYTAWYTDDDLAGLFNAGIPDSALDHVLVDGKSIREICALETDATLSTLAVTGSYAGDSFNERGFTLTYSIDAKALINMTAEHTLTIKKGLLTPLLGLTSADQSFRFNPLSRKWNELTDSQDTSASAVDYGYVRAKTPADKKGLIIGLSLGGALLVAGAVVLIVVLKRRKYA